MKLNPLTQEISKYFSIHPSRQNTMAAMVFSVLCSNNAHHQSLARYVYSPNPKAALRKVERFFCNEALSPLLSPQIRPDSLSVSTRSICCWNSRNSFKPLGIG